MAKHDDKSPQNPPRTTDPKSGSSNYKDRPTNDGKYGDADKEPTPALPGSGKRTSPPRH
jgi:hypothetical protein